MYPYNSFMHQWAENQKKMIDLWQEPFMPKKENKSSKECEHCNHGNDFMEWTKQWNEMSYELFSKNSKFFMGMPHEDLFNKMTASTNVYQNLYGFWRNLTESFINNENHDIQKFFNNWQDEYTKMLSKNFISYLPQPIQSFFREPMEISQMYVDLSKKLMQPWLDSTKQFKSLFDNTMFENKYDFLGFKNLWMENYEETLGKFFKMPAFGINRELSEVQLETMDSFMKYANNLSHLYSTMQHVGIDTLKDIINDYQGMLKNETQPQTFKEFYDYWWKKNEEAYLALFNTEDFSKLLSQVVDAGLELKKSYDHYLEQQLSFLPLPTMSDMKSLYKSNYELRKEVRKLQKEVTEISNKNKFEK